MKKKLTEKAGKEIGSSLKGLTRGIYKGFTGLTDKEIELNNRIEKNANKIHDWAFLIFLLAGCLTTVYLINASGFNTKALLMLIKDSWMIYLVEFIGYVFIVAASGKIAKEITV